MNLPAIRHLIRQGEDSSRQFKEDVVRNIRNPILVSYVAKGLLPYRGLGSGIKRALEDWPDIAFTDDRDGCQGLRTKCSGCLPGYTLDSPSHLQSAIAPVFTAAVARKSAAVGSIEAPVEKPDPTREKTREKILRVLAASPEISMVGLTEQLGISAKGVEWQIREMKKAGILKRIGPDKGGHWKVISP